jgi:GNAT superfamily N-acetyltransferase
MGNEITFQAEPFANLMRDGKELFNAHWEEIASHKDKVPLNPNYDAYLHLCEGGLLHTVTTRIYEKLVGYFMVVVVPHLHYQDCVIAQSDILYLMPEVRGNGAGTRLIQFVESYLKSFGVHRIIINCKVAHDFGGLLEELGYKFIEKVYDKYIG